MTGAARAFIFLAVFAAASTAHPASAAPRIEEIAQEYDLARYGRAISMGKEFLESDNIRVDDEIDVRRLLAFSYAALGLNGDAAEEFLAILRLKPDFELDRALTSPKILGVFEDARAKAVDGRTTRIGDRDNRAAAAWSALFPGLGQIYKGQRGKGYAMAASEVLLLSAAVYSHIEYDNSHSSYLSSSDPEEIESSYDSYNRWYRARLLFGGAAVALWVYSHIDAALLNEPSNADEPRSYQLLLGSEDQTVSVGVSIPVR